jgi:hypothetical protein
MKCVRCLKKMPIKVTRWFLASLFCLSACSEDKLVVIQPGVFGEDWPTVLRNELVTGKRCRVDQINGKDPNPHSLVFKSGETLTLSGWMFPNSESESPALYVQMVGPALTYTALAQKRPTRDDVNQYFKLDQKWNAGFELQATQNAEPSEYQLWILQPGSQGVVQCKTKVVIKIDPATPA